MHAMNQADGILHRKISRTVRSCHLPNSPFTLPITSTFSISTWASSNASISFVLCECADGAYALSSGGGGVKDGEHCDGLLLVADGSRRRESMSNGISAYRFLLLLFFFDSANWKKISVFVRLTQNRNTIIYFSSTQKHIENKCYNTQVTHNRTAH